MKKTIIGTIPTVQVEEGKMYLCENGKIVKVKKTKLPYYKFKVDIFLNTDDTNTSEVWGEGGDASHFDCGYNFVREVTEKELPDLIKENISL